jgi:hypothetical protein
VRVGRLDGEEPSPLVGLNRLVSESAGDDFDYHTKVFCLEQAYFVMEQLITHLAGSVIALKAG